MAIAPCIDCRIVEKTLWKRLDLRGKGKLFSFVSRSRIFLRTCFLASSSAGGSLRLPTGLIKCDITSHIKPGKQNIGSNKAVTCLGSILSPRRKERTSRANHHRLTEQEGNSENHQHHQRVLASSRLIEFPPERIAPCVYVTH